MAEQNKSALVHYRVELKNLAAHLLEVTCTIPDPTRHGQIVALPAWIPGSYMVRDFAKNIVTISASCGGETVHLEKLDKQTWQAFPCLGPLTITCEIYAWDLSVRSAHVDTTHAYFNGTSVFLQVRGREHEACYVEIVRPAGEQYRNWQLATTLAPVEALALGFGVFKADDYQDLIDHPVEMGEFSIARFDACGVPHEVVVTGRHNADMARLARDLPTICEHHIRFFGEPAPMARYQFQVLAVGDGYGGLEHRSSTSLLCSREDLPQPHQTDVTDEYRNFLGLCSHEYFHAWMVKRIKPAVFMTYDLAKEVYTRQLWAFEGITSYYDELALVRTGLINEQSYLELLGQTITRVLRSKGRFKQSVTDSSFDAWTKFYKQDENATNAIISYYVKGALVALGLDLKIRATTAGAKSLDDVMRALWQRYGLRNYGLPERGFEQVAEEISGLDLKAYFAEALYGTADIPLRELLKPFGIDYLERIASSQTDKGGKPPAANGKPAAVSLHIKTGRGEGGVSVSNVYHGGSAQIAGIAAGDLLVAIDGLKLSQDNLEKRLARYRVGDTVRVHAFRRDELMEFAVRLQAPEYDTCYLVINDETPVSRDLRAKWLQTA